MNYSTIKTDEVFNKVLIEIITEILGWVILIFIYKNQYKIKRVHTLLLKLFSLKHK